VATWALLGEISGAVRLAGGENTDHADSAGGPDGPDQHVQRCCGVLVALWVVGLIADALAASIRADSLRLLQHRLYGVGCGVVDREGADLFGQLQPVRVAIDDHHLCRSLDGAGQADISPLWPAPAITIESAGSTEAISVA